MRPGGFNNPLPSTEEKKEPIQPPQTRPGAPLPIVPEFNRSTKDEIRILADP
jgi:hypothetical protein